MNSNSIKIDNDTGNFRALKDMGVTNFFSYSNEHWDTFSTEKIEGRENTKKIFEKYGIQSNLFFFLHCEHLDNIRIIDKQNLEYYKNFKSIGLTGSDVTISRFVCDSIITKEKIPVFVQPADCAILVFTGIDTVDGKRFIAIGHCGVYGVILNLHLKIFNTLKSKYKFFNQDLHCYIFPSIEQKDYKKKLDDKRNFLIDLPEWKKYISLNKDSFGIDFKGKIIDDLLVKKINIEDSGLNTYDENKYGKLFSYVYSKENNIEPSNFCVGVMLK